MTNATPNILKNNVDIPLFILNFLSSFCDRGLIINANKPPIKNGAIYPNVLITTKNSSEYMIKNIILFFNLCKNDLFNTDIYIIPLFIFDYILNQSLIYNI